MGAAEYTVTEEDRVLFLIIKVLTSTSTVWDISEDFPFKSTHASLISKPVQRGIIFV